jgi:hypothetical protein
MKKPRLLRHMLLLVGCLIATVALARVPLDFTLEERAQFTDALKKYPRKELPRVKPSQTAIGWIDDHTVALSVRETPDGWKAANGELAKVITINTDTLEIQDSGHRGELVCYSPARVILRQPKDGSSMLNHRKDDSFFAGKWGGKLDPISWKYRDHFLARWSCEQQPLVTELPSKTAVKEIRLLPGHGRLVFPVAGDLPAGAFATAETVWLKDDDTVIQRFPYSKTGAPRPERLMYLPWENSYFSTSGAYRRYSNTPGMDATYFPEGRIDFHDAPELLRGWEQEWVGSGQSRISKAGRLWFFRGLTGYWRKQGIYLEAAGKLLRVDDGEWFVSDVLAISSDGCRIIDFRGDGDPLRRKPPIPLVMMNFCEAQK